MWIDRGYETMTHKERVVKTMNHEKPDRVPMNYFANEGVDQRLKAHFGLAAGDGDGLLSALGADFRGVNAGYIGPRLHAELPERRVNPELGFHLRYVAHQSGGYWDYCDFPLMNASVEEIAAHPFPSPDMYDYDGALARAEKNPDHALYVGGPGLACVINTAGFFRGMEQVFVDLITGDPAGLLLIDRFMDLQLKRTERLIERLNGRADFMWIGEDLGTQFTPLISMKVFREVILPRQKPFFDLAKAHGLPVMIHTCGCSSWSYEEYIKLGLSGVDTLQPEAATMDPRSLIAKFGQRLFYHGCISTAGPLATGTVAEVEASVRETLDIMMPGYGYMLAPTHSIQDNTPTENALAMYRVGHTHGRYR